MRGDTVTPMSLFAMLRSPSLRLRSLRALLAAGAWTMVLTSPVACVTEAALKDLCDDDATCTSAPDCPSEPPNQGVACDLAAGAECYYCSDGGRIDASHYTCNTNGRWDRNPNTDCN